MMMVDRAASVEEPLQLRDMCVPNTGMYLCSSVAAASALAQFKKIHQELQMKQQKIPISLPPTDLNTAPWLIKNKSSFVHSIISSRLNTRYIQPHYPLADNIISHGVSWSTVLQLYTSYKNQGIFTPILQTKYYDLDKVFTVAEKQSGASKQYRVIYRNDHQVLDYSPQCQSQTTIEYVGENQFILDKETFQVKKSYHHERQMILYVLDTPHFTVEIEILLDGLDTFDNRKHLFSLMTKPDLMEQDPAILGSFSFRFIVKDGMVRDELNEHVDLLHEIISAK
jgi:hypothetical protein